MEIPVTTYVYVDEYIIADDVKNNCTAPFTEDDILIQIDEYIDNEEEYSLIHDLTEGEIYDIYKKVKNKLEKDGYEVVE